MSPPSPPQSPGASQTLLPALPPGCSSSPRPADCWSLPRMQRQVWWPHPCVPNQPYGNRPRDAASPWDETGTSKWPPAWRRQWGWMCSCSTALLGAHGKGRWLLLQAPTASCRGPAWGHVQLPNQPLLPGSSPVSLGAVCASWMLLQAGKPLLVPALPLLQEPPSGTSHPALPSDPEPSPCSCCRSPFNSITPAVQRVLLSLCFRVNSESFVTLPRQGQCCCAHSQAVAVGWLCNMGGGSGSPGEPSRAPDPQAPSRTRPEGAEVTTVQQSCDLRTRAPTICISTLLLLITPGLC